MQRYVELVQFHQDQLMPDDSNWIDVSAELEMLENEKPHSLREAEAKTRAAADVVIVADRKGKGKAVESEAEDAGVADGPEKDNAVAEIEYPPVENVVTPPKAAKRKLRGTRGGRRSKMVIATEENGMPKAVGVVAVDSDDDFESMDN
ncbi:hypothetical protein KJ359_010175 [Pestalotiopsis sp. 9143b]|nr:hypothetical protein KJ359_010175 [Pestalotiopsis sp. 9143b]